MEQIITEDGRVVDNLEDHIKRIGVPEIGLDYHMTSIIGCQSSGKSTLLNLLFGTKFETMDEKRGRQQTTKGIHAAIAVDKPLLVFDVEGCDSRERGDADALFERKSSLFALALSEVMIVNMWESDIGRYNAANLPMLKTVFEVNVQLFQAQVDSKTTLLFLIRDYTTDNFEALTKNIYNDMNNIWKEINLPPEYKNGQIGDFFDFKFFAIHHMKIQRDIFDKDVEELKGWFLSPEDPNYLFKDKSHKNVPGDGLAQYITQLWDTIYENKELNIPSQRSMLSHFKCEENVKMLMSDLTEQLNETLSQPLKRKEIINNFKDICEGPVDNAFKVYKENTWRYIPDVVEDQRKEMQNQINDFLFPFFTKNVNLMTVKYFDEYCNYTTKLGEHFALKGHWEEDVNKHIDETLAQIDNKVNEMKFPPFENTWKYDQKLIKTQMVDFMNARKKNLIEDTHQTTTNSVLHTFTDEANEILKDANEQMWVRLRSLMSKKTVECENKIKSILSTNAPNDQVDNNINKSFEDQALILVKESAQYILLKMKTAFDRRFKYDNGRPRVWTKDDDVNQIFESSRKAGEDVLRLFQFCHLLDPNKKPIKNDPLNQILIDQEKYNNILLDYHRIIKHTFEEAKGVIKAQMAKDQIPPFAWFCLLMIGGDKILKWMTNPLFFTLVLFIGGGYFILNQLGLWDVAVEAGKKKFQEIVENIKGIRNRGNDNEYDEYEEEEEAVEFDITKAQTMKAKANLKLNINKKDDNDDKNNDNEDINNDNDEEVELVDLNKPLDSLVNPVVPDEPEETEEDKAMNILESKGNNDEQIEIPMPPSYRQLFVSNHVKFNHSKFDEEEDDDDEGKDKNEE